MDNITKFPPLHILPEKKPPLEPTEKPPFSFNQFSLNGNSAVMREKMLNDTFVLDGIAILGQATAIYAKPNTGKTLLVLWMLIDSIKAKRIKGENVFYINADDTYKGLVTKLEIAEQYGFHMIAPSHGGFETNKFQSYIRQVIDDNTAHGVVIILDTVKKFTDLMDKKQASNFMKIGREFISSGGTLIMMAGKNVRVDVVAVDQYGRNVGTVYVGGLNVNRELVKNGFAWVYRQYAHDPELLELEKAARAKRIGLWMLDNPIYPPDFRKHNK